MITYRLFYIKPNYDLTLTINCRSHPRHLVNNILGTNLCSVPSTGKISLLEIKIIRIERKSVGQQLFFLNLKSETEKIAILPFLLRTE